MAASNNIQRPGFSGARPEEPFLNPTSDVSYEFSQYRSLPAHASVPGYSEKSEWLRPRNPPPSNRLPSFTSHDALPAFNDQAQHGSGESRPFLTQYASDNNTKSQNSAAAGRISIQRKPVAAITSVQEDRWGDDEGSSKSGNPISQTSSEGIVAARRVKPLWRVWGVEVACILLSILLFMCIVVVLFKFDQQTLPDWPLGITLNSFLAFFTTCIKAAFMVPVSVAISQAQWNWFNRAKPQPLYDFHVIDQASRGPWGSLVLLWRFRFRHIVAWGALLVAISASTSPVTQLAIDYPSREVAAPGEKAVTHATWDLNSPRDRIIRLASKAVSMSFFLDSTGFEDPLSYATAAPGGVSCSTGNCTFGRYQSLGVCMKMTNISSHLRVEEFATPNVTDTPVTGIPIPDTPVIGVPIPDRKMWRASLPDKYYVAHQSKLTMFTDMLDSNLTFGFRDDPHLQAKIASHVVIYTNPTIPNKDTWLERWSSSAPKDALIGEMLDEIQEFRHDAVEVLFYLCVHTYETEVVMGVEHTRVIESSAEPLESADQPFLDIACESLSFNHSTICAERPDRWNETLALRSRSRGSPAPVGLDADGGEVFATNYRAMEELASATRQGMAGMVSVGLDPIAQTFRLFVYGHQFTTSLHQSVLFDPIVTMPYPEARQAHLENIYQNVATSLSASLRTGHLGVNVSASATFNVTGEAMKEMAYVRITWAWMSLLAFEIAAAALILAVTIISQRSNRASNRDDPSVFRDAKNSSLAALVALSETSRAAAGGGLGPVDDLERVAKGLKVRLEGGQIVVVEKDAGGRSEKT